MRYIFAIDPGNLYSTYVVISTEDYRPSYFGKVPNDELMGIVKTCHGLFVDEFVIERVACYGMPVGREVFDTCEWIGRFSQTIESQHEKKVNYILRAEEKMMICHSMNAKDSNIRRALIDRFATHDLKNGKGTKKHPDFFYGFSKDVWSAYAVGLTYIEKQKEESQCRITKAAQQ